MTATSLGSNPGSVPGKRQSAVLVLNITLFWGGWSESIPSLQEERMLWK